jgi:hypothetical protein
MAYKPDQSCGRRRIDNGSSALGEHLLELVFHTQPDPGQVHGDDLMPSCVRILCGERPVVSRNPQPQNPSIIVRTVQSAIPCHGL